MKVWVDRCYRAVYKVVYRVGSLVIRLTPLRIDGVFLFVWHGERLLIVKNSYKRHYSLPGGILKRGEDPILGAIREAREEVGLELDPADLLLFDERQDDGNGTAYMVKVRVHTAPPITIDEREIVWADFVHRDQLARYPFHQLVLAGLAHPENTPAESVPG